jgi:hypothetical protein
MPKEQTIALSAETFDSSRKGEGCGKKERESEVEWRIGSAS